MESTKEITLNIADITIHNGKKKGVQKSDDRLLLEAIYIKALCALRDENIDFDLNPANFKNILEQIIDMRPFSKTLEQHEKNVAGRVNIYFKLNNISLTQKLISSLSFLFSDPEGILILINKMNSCVLKTVYSNF